MKKIKAKARATPPKRPEIPTLLKLCRNAKPSLYNKKINKIVATVNPLQNK